MAYQLTHLLQDAYVKLGQANVSVATGGSTTTVVDTDQTGQHADDDWNRGTLIITRDSAGGGAAPEGEFSVISDYVDSSGTFTVSTLSAAAASGDRFMFTSELYPLNTMIELTNTVLRNMGDMDLVDTTTLDTTASQTEYAASLAWKRRGPYRIDMQTNTSDANDNRWQTIRDWEYIPDAAGSTGLIILPQLPVSRDLRIWYRDLHDYVMDFDDPINEAIPPEKISLALVEAAVEWQVRRQQGGDDFLLQLVNDTRVQTAEAETEKQIHRPAIEPKLMITNAYTEDDEFTTPGPA